MKQISINFSTYAKLVRLAALTNQNLEMWADAVLFRAASDELRALETKGGTNDGPQSPD